MDIVDFIAASVLSGLSRLVRLFPVGFALGMGRCVGALLFYSGLGRYHVAYRNMRAAFSSEKTPAEIRKMVKGFYQNFGETFAEILYLKNVDKKYIQKYVKIANRNYFDEAIKKGKGVIFLTAHYGNWELSGIVSSLEGYPLYVLAREQKMKRLNEFINRVRESKGSKVVRKGITTRYIVKGLHENKIIGMLADQNAGANGIMADFFGRPASTAYGPYRIGAATGAVIMPVFMVREKGPYHKLCLEDPIEIKKDEDILPYIQRYNGLLEKYVREHPCLWLWGHRRWKLCPVKRVMVLSDGKAGHLNQSLSLVKRFKRYRQDKNINDSDTIVEIIDVKFRNVFMKSAVNLSCLVPGFHSQGYLRLLKNALVPESFEKIIRAYADVVISTGFAMAGVNRIVAIENGAKSAVSMRPGYLGYKAFDMVVMAGHDVRGNIRDKNVIVTPVSPNIVDKEYLAENRAKLSSILKMENSRSIGFIFGGDNDIIKYDDKEISAASDNILKAAKKINADILVTTSRRTGKAQEKIVKEKFSGEQSCKLLVIANEHNEPFYMGGILGTADILVVSGDSVSMVSEAVDSGKRVVVLAHPGIGTGTKFGTFLKALEASGKISAASADNLDVAILNISSDTSVRTADKEEDLIYMNMWRLGG